MSDRDILPKGLTPVHYDLKVFNIDIPNLTFAGTVAIEYSVQKAVSTIYLNARDLEVTQATVAAFSSKTESTIPVKSISYDKATEIVSIDLLQTIDENSTKVVVTVDYTAIIQTNMAGFYRSQYKDQNGNDAVMLSTQFEATDARRAFPCADEPDLKATFDVSVEVPEDWTALSNMPVISSTTPGDGKKSADSAKSVKIVKFETTPIMSTYLLAWAAGDFEYVEAFTERSYNGKKVPVRVYTTRGLSKQGELALHSATKIIDYFSTVFDIDYALPKADLLAVHEFSHGAMENWGLVTYRTTAVLFDEATSAAAYKTRVVYVVAHELAHQWFGNLVTMSWWRELWLNEGYATYVGWLAVDYLYPEWNVFSRFISEGLQSALTLDALRQSHPIEVPVKSALDIDQIFDAISYLKGASVIRMISNQLTDKVFVKGVSNYLKEHSYSNATTVDLWSALSKVSGVDVNAVMSTWTLKIGFPLITVTEKENGDVVLRQDRFLSTGDATESENETLWWVPIALSSGPNAEDKIDAVSTFETREVTIPGLAKEPFFLLNKDQVGVYRVNYSAERLTKIAANVDKLSLNDKIGLVADAASTAIAGLGSTAGFLEVVSALKDETDFNLWAEVFKRLDSLSSAWFEQPTEVQDALEKFTQFILKPTLSKVGWEFAEDEDYLTGQLRTLFIGKAVSANVPEVLETAKGIFAKWKSGDKKAIHPSLRGAVFRAALKTSGAELEENYNAIFEEVTNPSSVDSREIALVALGKVKDEKLIDLGLSYTLSDKVAKQDIHSLAGSIAGNPLGRWKAWEYVQANWDAIYERFSPNMVVLDRLVKVTLQNFASQKAYDEIEAFYKDKNNHGYDRTLGQVLDTIKAKTQWINRESEVVKSWLQEKKFL
ncbi:hypothetical protein DV454_001537 [Geotrichum candidum]|nr:hypothetical protein DV454_001537 [Geotrichum candidum]